VIQDSSVQHQVDGHGSGERLRQARVAAGLSLQEVGGRLKMPIRTLEALEQGHWQQIGAPVFVRGQLRSYAKLLGVDLGNALDEEVAPAVAVKLVSHAHTPRYRHVLENAGRRAVYVAITAAFFAVPVWLATRAYFGEEVPATASLDAVPAAPLAGMERPLPAAPEPAPQSQVQADAPYVASMAPPVSRSAAVPAGAGLVLEFSGDSWMQVTGRDGQLLEQALVRSGESRSFKAVDVSRVVLGNAAVVRVQQSGAIVDLGPYRRANVARFAVSSDGSVGPAE
jgi:cytoskeleton protein RodZ